MLILECSQGCYAVKIWPLDLWPWKSIGFQTLPRTMYVPCLVKIHWRMLILECSQGCYAVKIWPGDIDFWPMTLKINRVPDSPKDYVCTKFGQNPLKDVDSSVQKDVMRYKFDPWPWKSIGFQTLRRTKYVPSLVKIHLRILILVFTRMLRGKNLTQWPWPLTYDLENQ
jgi:hypothetical protein